MKDKYVELVAQGKDGQEREKMYDEGKYVVANTNNLVCEEKGEINNEKLRMDNSKDFTQEELGEIDEHLAFMSRRFSELKFKRNPNMSKSST